MKPTFPYEWILDRVCLIYVCAYSTEASSVYPLSEKVLLSAMYVAYPFYENDFTILGAAIF